ncbi:MAG: hypothetical protein HKP61_13105 [Dactylosporangium sp.]|nr:hypothetical protein [Dactylosporangium sp.]NNJ61854.1 hypothetical protein [Dactylosporangium sp.]
MTTAGTVRVRLFRDPDPSTATVAGMAMGQAEVEAPAAVAGGWFRAGVRRAVLSDFVDLDIEGRGADPAEVARRLVLVRELTSYGIAVEWRLRLAGNGAGVGLGSWRMLSHLAPPHQLCLPADNGTAATRCLAEWQRGFAPGLCCYRRGPGFIQVSDRRSGSPHQRVIDRPTWLAAIGDLAGRGGGRRPDQAIVGELRAAGLVTHVGAVPVWLPYRSHRRPT